MRAELPATFRSLVARIAIRRTAVPLALLLGLLCVPIPARAPTAVAGIVVDETSSALPGVQVTMTGETVMGERLTVTDMSGAYRFEMQTPGTVRLQFELQGFGTMAIEKVVVRAGSTTTSNATMKIAAQSENVFVIGATPVVDRESAQVGVNFSSEMLSNLPNTRDLWVVLSQSPGVSVTRFDVGGSAAGVQTSYRSYGYGGQNFVGLDGIMTTEGTGGAIVYMDYGSFGEVQVVGAAKGADIAVPGTYTNSVVKTGTNQFRGQAYLDWEHDNFQSDNLTPELRAAGVLAGDRVDRYNDFNWQFGGPIRRDKLWFFYSGREQHVGVQAIGFADDAGNPVPFYTDLRNHSFKINTKLSRANELIGFYSYNFKVQPYRGGGGGGGGGEGRFFTTSSAGNQEMPAPAAKLGWTNTSIAQSVFETSLNYVGQDFCISRRVDEISRRDLDTLLVRGGFSGVGTGFSGTASTSIPFCQQRTRMHVNPTWTLFTDRLGVGTHNVKTGYVFNFEEYKFPQYGTLDHAIYYYRNNFQTPAFVETYDTPLETIDRLQQHSFFINDRLSVGRRWTLNIGVRMDAYRAYYPAQGNPGTGPFASALEVPGRSLPTLVNWVPRLSAIYDVFGNGTTAVKASYGRYAHNTGVLTTNINPVGRTQRRYTWDGTLPFVPDPARLVSTSGGRDQDISPDLSNAYVDEWTFGVDQKLTADLFMRFNVVQRYENNRFQTINAALPYEAYNRQVAGTDIGPDAVSGTSDDRSVTFFALDPAYVGRFKGLLTNTPDGFDNSYLSYDVQVSKSLSRNFDLLGSYTANHIEQWPNGKPQNPNDEFFSDRQDYWEWTAKVMGSYHAPGQIRLSTVLKGQSGEPYGRQLRSPSLTQGTITVLAEPSGTYKYPTTTLWDFRVARAFNTGGSSLELALDVYNLLNKATVSQLTTLTGPNFNRQVIRILNPRIAKIGVKLTF